jgi:hypothetical protein
MDSIRIYKYVDSSVIFNKVESIKKFILKINPSSDKVEFNIDKTTSYFYYRNLNKLSKKNNVKNEKEAKSKAESFFSESNSIIQSQAVFRQDNFPRLFDNLKFVSANTIIDTIKNVEYWKCNFQPYIFSGDGSEKAAPVTGAKVAVFVGGNGNIVGLDYYMRPMPNFSSKERLKIYSPTANPIPDGTDITYKADSKLGLVAPFYVMLGDGKKLNKSNNLLASIAPFIPAAKESLSLINNVPEISGNNQVTEGIESRTPIKEVSNTPLSEDDLPPNPQRHILTYYIENVAVQTMHDSKGDARTTVYIEVSWTGFNDTKEHDITKPASDSDVWDYNYIIKIYVDGNGKILEGDYVYKFTEATGGDIADKLSNDIFDLQHTGSASFSSGKLTLKNHDKYLDISGTISENIILGIAKYNASHDIDAPRAIAEELKGEGELILGLLGFVEGLDKITFIFSLSLPSTEKLAKLKMNLRRYIIMYYDGRIRNSETSYFTEV